MALHDFYCDVCSTVVVDVNVPATIGAVAGAPDHCGHKMQWIPQTRAMDVGGVKGAAFTAFDCYDGQNRKVRVENYRQMHKLEQESEQQYRNGEGQPLRFRALHQNRSNMLSNTFGDGGQEKPSASAIRRFAPRPSSSEPGFGPGVNESNCSALKE